MTTPSSIRVLCVDDHRIVREGIALILAREPDIEVVASAANADEAVADFVARDVTGTRRSSRCSTGRLDMSIYRYSAACYYEIVYIQGGNLLNEAKRRMGSTLFYSTLRKYVVAQHFRISTTPTLLKTLDDATPLYLSALFRPQFPSIY